MPAAWNVDGRYVARLLKTFVETPSVNPEMDPDREWSGEARAADVVARELEVTDFEVERIEHGAGRASVLATLHGSEPGPTLMLNGHIDTVPPGRMPDPFVARALEGRVHGRGSYDMKGGVAGIVAAARSLAESGVPFKGVLQVSAVADEETESKGTRAVLERGIPDGVVVTEPTGLVPCSAHRGFSWIRLRTRGRAAHGSMPDRGVDANLMMGRVLALLDRLAAGLADSDGHPLAGRGSLHVGRLQGGEQWSVYADRCELDLERRTVPGETGRDVLVELQAGLNELSADPDFHCEAELVLDRPPLDADPRSDLMRAILGTGMTKGNGAGAVPFWTDAALFAEAGADAVVLGPTGAGAHADQEWVEVGSVVQLAKLLVATAVDYLNDPCGR